MRLAATGIAVPAKFPDMCQEAVQPLHLQIGPHQRSMFPQVYIWVLFQQRQKGLSQWLAVDQDTWLQIQQPIASDCTQSLSIGPRAGALIYAHRLSQVSQDILVLFQVLKPSQHPP